ncbi:MAG: Stp1/IreP family PP2C-type Ser/Thr phosphatase [Solirubrobacteraceae bacterium]
MLRIVEMFEGTDTGRQRRANEDSHFVRSPLFVVADGMGGARAGEVASRTAVEAFEEGLPATGSPEQRLAGVIVGANERIHGKAQADDQLAGMGTTLTAVLVGETDVSIAHVGDSRAYLFRDSQLVALTQDHSLVNELVQRGKLTPEQAAEHPQRSIITRALGPEAAVEVDTQSRRARDGDVYLLCSDGLTSMIDDGTVARILGASGSLEEAGRGLIEAANEAGGRDNITVVLFRVSDDGAAGEEQPTEVGTMRVDDVREAAAAQATRRGEATATAGVAEGTASGGGAATREAAPPTEAAAIAGAEATQVGARTGAAPPPKRTAPLPEPKRSAATAKRRRRLRFGGVVFAAVFLALLAALVGGVLLYARAHYFIGVGTDGFVTVYRGLDAAPFGVDLNSVSCATPVVADAVPRENRRALDRRSRTDRDEALAVVRTLYRKQLALAAGRPTPDPCTG